MRKPALAYSTVMGEEVSVRGIHSKIVITHIGTVSSRNPEGREKERSDRMEPYLKVSPQSYTRIEVEFIVI